MFGIRNRFLLALAGVAGLLALIRKAPTMPPVTFRPGLPTSPRKEPVQYLVIHHSATYSADSTYNVLLKKELSTHYEIEPSGKIWQYADPEKDKAFHASSWNARSVGIDLTGPIDGTFTEAQKASLIVLIEALAAKFKIPLKMAPWGYDPSLDEATFKGIVAHANVKATKPDPSYSAKTTDGALWDELQKRIA